MKILTAQLSVLLKNHNHEEERLQEKEKVRHLKEGIHFHLDEYEAL